MSTPPSANTAVSPETQQQLQQQQQDHEDWKNLVSTSLKTNAVADSKKERDSANELPSPIVESQPNENSTRNNNNNNNQSSPATTLFPPIQNNSRINNNNNNNTNQIRASQPQPNQEAPWTRWQVEARLNEKLYPVEKRLREERRIVDEEKHRFAMHLPRSPQVFFSPPTTSQFSRNSNTVAPESNDTNQYPLPEPRNAQQQQSTWEAENFNLRERVRSLEEQLQFFRNQIDNHLNVRTTAKRRRYIQYLSAVMDSQAKRRVALRLFGKWMRFAKQRRMDATVKDARDSAGKEIMETSLQRELLQQEKDVSRKQLMEERERNKIILREREELLTQQQTLGKRVEELENELAESNNNNNNNNNFVSPSPANRNNTNKSSFNRNVDDNKLALSPNSNNNRNSVPSSPYAKVNQNLYLQQGANRAANNNNNSKATPLAAADGDSNNEINSSFQEERQQLGQRIEQLSLRCMDQDEVIRTLFIELAAVGKELQVQKQSADNAQNNISEYYTTAEAASMLLRQSVDPNVEQKTVESVTSPWPRLRNPTNNQNNNSATIASPSDIGSVRRNNNNNNNNNRGTPLNPINSARMLDAEYNERMMLEEQARNGTMIHQGKKVNRDGSPFEL